MKISKEVKVGLLGLVGLVLLYYGFTFLKGSDLFTSTKNYKTTFKDVQGLSASNTVTYNGVVVGRVASVSPDYENDKVDVVVSLNKDVKVTDKTQIILGDDGLIGGKLLVLKVAAGKDLPAGSEIPSGVELGMLDAVTNRLDPTLKNVDSLMLSLNRVVKDFENSGQALKVLMASATQTTTGLNGIMASNSKNLNTVVGNAAVLTAQLNGVVKNLDAQLKPILTNFGSLSDSLSKVELASTVANLNKTVSEFQSVVKEINDGKGTIGKVMKDDSLYTNLNNVAASLDRLLVDFKEKPKRYVHFSLFGKKDKK